MRSIQSRLTLGLLISLLTIFMALWLLVSYSIQELAENYTASRLHHDIETLLNAIEFDQQDNLTLNQERINPIYKRPFSGHYYTIHYNQTIFRSRSLWDQKLQLQTTRPGTYTHAHQKGPDAQPLIIVSSDFSKQGKTFTISVAEDLNPLIENIQQFKNLFAFIAAIALSILLLIQILILRHGLGPLKLISNELAELEQGHINKLKSTVPTELKPVVSEINHLLNILNKRLKRSRDALSDLSHALKKPLTVLHQLSQQTNDQNSPIDSQVEEMTKLTDRILKRARLTGGIQAGTLFSFEQDLPLLLKTITTIYPHKNIEINTEINIPYPLNIDREDMLELLGNLIDNAYKWAATKIQFNITQSHNLIIKIEDDGPGCQPELLVQLAKRGVRLDEKTQGHGFGLAISADIVSDYKGNLSFHQSQTLGGFMVQIEFPSNFQ